MKCYLCDKDATSSEHCPPKSFFPVSNRVDLITVPSCVEHNEKNSLDDEYIRNVIAMTMGNNDIGTQHSQNKVLRGLNRKDALFKLIVKNPKLLPLDKSTASQKGLAFEIDRIRFDRAIRKISYGLYFHKYGITWNYELGISTKNLVTAEIDIDPVAERLKQYPDLTKGLYYEGKNPDVFKYSFVDFDISHHKWLHMRFYDFFETWTIPIDSSTRASLD